MEEEDAGQEVEPKEEGDELMHLQFPVATITQDHVNLRAYFNRLGQAEWLWPRVQDYLGTTTYGGRYLKSNMPQIKDDMQLFGVPESQLHYKAQGYQPPEGEPWKEHTLESRWLLSFLITCLKAKQAKADVKENALKLFLALAGIALRKGISSNNLPSWPHVTVTALDGSSRRIQLTFNKFSLCQAGWAEAMQECLGAQSHWAGMSQSESWRSFQITSQWQHAKLEDILAFLLHLSTQPKLKVGRQVLWAALGYTTLCSMLFFVGGALEIYAKGMSSQPVEELPIMKTGKGFVRKSSRSDSINKVVLLQKLKHERLHRWRIAKTHANLVSEHCTLMKREAYLMSVLYEEKTSTSFAGVKQLSVAWDPSNYGGTDTLVGMIYCIEKELSAYLIVQPLRRLLVRDLDEELQEQGRKGKLEKLEGYIELRALSAALKNLGITLSDFQVPSNLHLRPVKEGELRVQDEHGRWYIGKEGGEFVPQIPPALNLSTLPCLVSISDQGPQNMPALNFIQYSENALLCTCLYDPFHRAWNDIKLACKRATSYPWRTILELTVVYNLSYMDLSAVGSWFHRKQDCLKDFLNEHSADSTVFQDHLPHICRELSIAEPQSLEAQETLLRRLANMKSFCEKGPLVKLMRWFSYFESAVWFSGELFATRMVMQACFGQFEDEEEQVPQGQTLEPSAAAAKDPRRELQELKKKKGTWKLAPQLITERNVDLQRMVLTICRATWKHHAFRAREIKSPQQVLTWNLGVATTMDWAKELEDMIRHSCWERAGLEQQFKEEPGEDRSALLAEHSNLLDELLCSRANSLATSALWIPQRYNGTLHEDPRVAAEALQKVKDEWQAVLSAESALAQGGRISFWQELVWVRSPFVRALFLAYEHNPAWGCALQKQVAQNLGDSRVVEVAHSKTKDVLKEGRAFDVGLTSIQHQLQMSGALEERKVPSVQVAMQDKVFGDVLNRLRTPLLRKMNPRRHKLPLSLQKMMQKQGVTMSWPSPSPQSFFGIQAATEWFFTFIKDGLRLRPWKKPGKHCWQEGAILAQRSTGLFVKVLCAAEFGMLAWTLQIEDLPDGSRLYLLHPDRANLQWHHIYNLEDWVAVPCAPKLKSPGVGPLGWIKVGDPLSLLVAVCLEGVHITVKQTKKLLMEIEVPFEHNKSRREFATRGCSSLLVWKTLLSRKPASTRCQRRHQRMLFLALRWRKCSLLWVRMMQTTQRSKSIEKG